MRVFNKKTLMAFIAGLTATVCSLSFTPTESVKATDYPDQILLGSFWESDNNNTDTVYWSTNGVDFYELSEAYTDATPNDSSTAWIDTSKVNFKGDKYNVSTLHDPSIIYKDGYFWMLSGFNKGSGDSERFLPMMGCSKDLVNWSFPNAGDPSTGYVKLTQKPAGSEKYGNTWDSVAPDFFVDDDGTVWMTMCAGYYAQWHNDDQLNDIMQPYLIKLTGLQPGADPSVDVEAQPKVTYSDAVPINLPQYNSDHKVNNRIDGSFYKEGEYYYYMIKKDGVTNEIWRTKNLSLDAVQKESNWELVCDDAVTGFEGPCLTKYNGQYLFYTDKLKDYPGDSADGKTGIWVDFATLGQSGKLDSSVGFIEDNHMKVHTYGADGKEKDNRHGTVITITDKQAIKTICDLKATTRYANQSSRTISPVNTGWYVKESFKADRYGAREVFYRYENGKRLGTEGFGEEKTIDGNTYYFEAANNGAAVVGNIDVYNKKSDGTIEVWNDAFRDITVPVDGNNWKTLRYNHDGIRITGWDVKPDPSATGINDNRYVYYFDEKTGARAKGAVTIYDEKSGKNVDWFFDKTTGRLQISGEGSGDRIEGKDYTTALVERDGKLVYLKNGQVDTSFTGLAPCEKGLFMVVKGYVDYNYNGFNKYEGNEFAVVNGKVDTNYNGFISENGEVYIVINGSRNTSDSGYTAPAEYNGNICMFTKGKLDKSYTGLAAYKDVWYMMVNGYVDRNYNGIVTFEGCPYVIKNGVVDGNDNSCNGLMQDENGVWWKIVNGNPDTSYTGLAYDANVGWWYVENGAINFGRTGLVYDANVGWWYVENGAINFGRTGLVYDENVGWWYVENGAINFGRTGLVYDANVGWWYVENGGVSFGCTGIVYDENVGWWYVENGGINFGRTGIVYSPNVGWWYVENGAINFGRTGLVYDENVGWWYVENGAINFGYTGLVYDANVGWWNVENGMLIYN